MRNQSTNPPTTQSTGNTAPLDDWRAADPPICPTCGCDHSYAAWEDRDSVRGVIRENAALRDRVARLRSYAYELEERMQDEDTTFPVVTREAHIADAQKQAAIQPGDLDGAGEGGDA